jgi:hypothetical protein
VGHGPGKRKVPVGFGGREIKGNTGWLREKGPKGGLVLEKLFLFNLNLNSNLFRI